MTSQPTSVPWEEGSDLHTYVAIIVRHKRLIAGLIAVALAIATVLSYVVLPPSYESSVVLSLPRDDGANGLGMVTQGYKVLAESSPVTERLKQKLGLLALRGSFNISLDSNLRLLTVTASARTAEEAKQLASAWVDAFHGEALTFIEGQLTAQKTAAQQDMENLLSRLTKAEDRLASFNKQNPISLMEAQLSSMERELVNSEQSLRELTTTSIPIDEARQAFLESALAKEPRTLAGQQGNVSVPTGSAGAGVTSSDVTILNPVYLNLSQDLATTRTRLVANRREAETLQGHISPLRSTIEGLRTTIVEAKTEQVRLDRQRQEAVTPYESARLRLDTLLASESRLPELARIDVLREPVQPGSPIRPRKAYNMMVGGLAGAVLGLVMAFMLEWNRSTAPVSVAPARKAATMASPGENAD